MDPSSEATPRPAAELARLPLVVIALDGSTVLADRRFGPDATVTVGSNSRNDLVIPEKFELTAYDLLSPGPRLHLARPLYVQTTVWIEDTAVPLKGFVRDLIRDHPQLAEPVLLASDRFLVRYSTGIALLGRFGG